MPRPKPLLNPQQPPTPRPTRTDAERVVRNAHRASPRLKKLSVDKVLKRMQELWDAVEEEKPWT